MKKIILTFLFGAFALTCFANDKYEKAMLKNIRSLYAAETLEDHQKVINGLTRIGNVEKDKWEPHYYIAYAYVMMSFAEADLGKKDQYLDLAQKAQDKGLDIAPEESELVTMQGFIHTARLNVDPMTRGAEYAGMTIQTLRGALAMNEGHPRALLLLGQMLYGTAEFMGESTDRACELIGKSLEKLKTETLSNPLAPSWGKSQAENALKRCDK